MRDYVKLLDWLRSSQNACFLYGCDECPADCENHEGDIFNDAADAIEELLAAVRSVVHCKDCKWCHAGYCEKYDDLIPWGCANKPWEDWFCADGAKMEVSEDDKRRKD